MNHYLLTYHKVADHAQRCLPLQKAHRKYIETALARGTPLLMGGNLIDEAGATALLLFMAKEPGPAESFAASDPYVTGGVVASWQVHEWDTVVGDLAAHPV